MWVHLGPMSDSIFHSVSFSRVWRLSGAVIGLVALLGLSPTPAAAQGAGVCVDAAQSGDKVVFSNRCNSNVYVLWCGALKYSKDRCGDGPKGVYHTHSANIEAGATKSIDVRGRIDYAACMGRIGFGNDRNYEDLGNGQIRCLSRR